MFEQRMGMWQHRESFALSSQPETGTLKKTQAWYDGCKASKVFVPALYCNRKRLI